TPMITKPVPALLCTPTGHGPANHPTPELAQALLIAAPVQQFTSGWECTFENERCMESVMYGIAGTPAGQAGGVAQEGFGIYDDYSNGRSAQGTGKVVFNLLLLAGTRGEGAGVAAAGKEAGLGARLSATASRAAEACSFSPETPVLMDGGKTKPIGKIEIGDKVQAAEQETGKHVGARTVTATMVNHDNDLTDLAVRTADGRTEVVHTTSKHPFWDDTLHTWVPAAKLTPGHALNTAENRNVHIVDVHVVSGAADMYNLTVAELHTYYVLVGVTPILVHNACPTPRATFVASKDGIIVPTSAARLQAGLQAAVDAGVKGFSTYPTKSAGVGYQLPNGSRIRIMQPSANGNAGLRASFTNGSDAPISPFTGKPVQPPKGVDLGMTPKEYFRRRTHVDLGP
ncbi:polymorphic toxin-type HINT domain-containing protein, partial [Streptomyces sp. PA03-6a]|nr:polymorphic toxin-type HINT domain-containing protein [Streptomyces sp. PA03-6a]